MAQAFPKRGEGGDSQPNSVNGYTVNNQGMGTSVQSNTYNPFNVEVTDDKYQKAFGKTTGLQATKKVRNAQTELFEKFNEVRTKLTRLSRDMSQPPEVRLSAQNCLAELEALSFRQLPEPAEKGNKQVRMMAFNDAVEDDYKKPNIKLMDDLINDYDLTTILSQMKRNTAQINATTVGVGAAVMANDDANTAALAQQIDQGVAVVLHQIQVSEGNVTRQIVKTGNQIIGVVRGATGKILERIDDTQRLVVEWGITNADLTKYYGKENLKATEHYGEANLNMTEYYGEANLEETEQQGNATRKHMTKVSQQNTVLLSKRQKISDMLNHEERDGMRYWGSSLPNTYRDATVRWLGDTADAIIANNNLSQAEKEAALDEITTMVDKESVISDSDKQKFNRKYRLQNQ